MIYLMRFFCKKRLIYKFTSERDSIERMMDSESFVYNVRLILRVLSRAILSSITSYFRLAFVFDCIQLLLVQQLSTSFVWSNFR